MSVAVFIPIKEHSARVPGKNFRVFADDKPLWRWTIDRIKDRYPIYVSTDSKDLLRAIEATYGCKFDAGTRVKARMRPKHLCGDHVSVNLLIEDFVDLLDDDDVVVQVHVTSPFLTPDAIQTCVNNIGSGMVDSCSSCDIVQARGWRKIDDRDYVPLNHNPLTLRPTQELQPIMVENSLVYGFNVGAFKERKNRITQRHFFFPASFPEGMDIDTEEDWAMCQAINEIMEP